MEQRQTAIIYARVSSAQQAAEELPIASQIESGMKRAYDMGAMVLEVFKDEGISGRNGRRAAFQEAVRYCGRNQVNFFITWNSARFARDHLADGNFRAELKRFGTAVVEVSDHIDEKHHDAWFFKGLRALINEKYSRDVGRDTKRSLVKNAKDGFFNGGRVPLGYMVAAEGKRRRLVIDETEVAIVRRVFALYLSGTGCKRIAAILNSEGITRRGVRWSKGNVVLILKSERYIGVTVFNRVAHDGTRQPEGDWIITKSHEAIITDEHFARAQTMLETRAPSVENSSPRSQLVFSGMMRCVHCGSMMHTETATGRSRSYAYYNCSGWLKRGQCKSQRIRADAFDPWLTEQLVEGLFTPERIQRIYESVLAAAKSWATERDGERVRIVKAMRITEAKLARLYDALEADGEVQLQVGDIAPRIKEHRTTLENLERELALLEAAPDIGPLKMDLGQAAEFLKGMVYNSGTPQQKRQFFGGFIDEIRVDGNSVEVEFRPEKIMNQPGVRLVHSGDSWLPDAFLLRTSGEKLLLQLPERLRRAA